MKCPACGDAMVEKQFGVTSWVCSEGCKSIWFGAGALDQLEEHDRAAAAALQAAIHAPRNNAGHRGQLTCPQCKVPMHAHRYDHEQDVNVDECYTCGGIFLDSGELSAINEGFQSDAEVDAYLDKLMNDNPAWTAAVAGQKADDQRLARLQHYTKWCQVAWLDKAIDRVID